MQLCFSMQHIIIVPFSAFLLKNVFVFLFILCLQRKDDIECLARNCWAISAEITKRRTSLNSDMSLTTGLPGWTFGNNAFLEPFHRRIKNCQRHGRTSTTLPRSKRQSSLHLRQALMLNTYNRLGNSFKHLATGLLQRLIDYEHLWAIVHAACLKVEP